MGRAQGNLCFAGCWAEYFTSFLVRYSTDVSVFARKGLENDLFQSMGQQWHQNLLLLNGPQKRRRRIKKDIKPEWCSSPHCPVESHALPLCNHTLSIIHLNEN